MRKPEIILLPLIASLCVAAPAHGTGDLEVESLRLENGRIGMEDTCAHLREKDDIKEFYLGLKDDGVRGERRWKKKKTWR